MKKSTGKLLIGLAVGVLLAGGIGAVAYGSDGFTNSDISTWFDGEWRAINFEDQTKEYTGSKIEPDIVLPDGFTYEITKIEKDGEEVDLETGAVEEGAYVFTITIKNDKESRDYFCNLVIVPNGGELETEIQEAKGIKLRVLKAEMLANGEQTQTIGYTMNPADADPNIKVESIKMGGSDASPYITASVDTAQKTITLTCKKAFGTKIEVKFVHADNPSISATLSCDYQKKLLTKSFTFNKDYISLSGQQLKLDVYKIYNELHSSGKFTFTASTDIVNNFTYSEGTIEFDKQGKSCTGSMNLGNNYGTSSALTSLKMSNGSYINLKVSDGLTFDVNDKMKAIANGVYGLSSKSYKVADLVYKDETGQTNNFSVEFVSSGSFLESFSLNNSNVVF